MESAEDFSYQTERELDQCNQQEIWSTEFAPAIDRLSECLRAGFTVCDDQAIRLSCHSGGQCSHHRKRPRRITRLKSIDTAILSQELTSSSKASAPHTVPSTEQLSEARLSNEGTRTFKICWNRPSPTFQVNKKKKHTQVKLLHPRTQGKTQTQARTGIIYMPQETNLKGPGPPQMENATDAEKGRAARKPSLRQTPSDNMPRQPAHNLYQSLRPNLQVLTPSCTGAENLFLGIVDKDYDPHEVYGEADSGPDEPHPQAIAESYVHPSDHGDGQD